MAYDTESPAATLLTSIRDQAINLIAVPAKASFVRPADTTAYAGGDLVANSTTAGSVAAMQFTGLTISGTAGRGTITGVTIFRGGANASQLRAHFAKATAPTFANGDNGGLSVSNLDLDNYIGFAEVSCAGTMSAGFATGHAAVSLDYSLAADLIYCWLEAMGAFTPASAETIGVKIRARRYQ